MKSKKALASITLILLIGISLLSTALAQSRVPGVAVGDKFKYTFDFEMNVSNSSSDLLPSLLEGLIAEVENIDSVTVTVTQVSGTTVTMQTVMQFKNGTQQTGTGSIDVASGQDTTQESSIGMFVIAANLNAGDKVYTTDSSGTINETVTKTYPSGNRQINHQKVVMNYDVSQEELSDFGITTPLQQSNTQETYWDRQTGALVEMTFNMTTRSSQVNADMLLNVDLVETSVFTVPEYSVGLLVVVMVVIVSLSMILVRHKIK